MIRMRMDFASSALGMGTSAVVLLPQETPGQIGMAGGVPREANGSPRIPVLYLLHGLSDDCTGWERRTSIERYASRRGIAVVMPEVRRSFYADEVLGEAYWTYVAHELPQLIQSAFRVSARREDTFVAGLSMGGFGAMKLALHFPERFAAAGSFSGVLDLSGRDYGEHSLVLPARVWGFDVAPVEIQSAVGQAFPPTAAERRIPAADDLVNLARQAEVNALPRLWVGCGTEDSLFDANQTFLAALRSRGVEPHVRFTPGAHTWDLWDSYVADFVDWLPLATDPGAGGE